MAARIRAIIVDDEPLARDIVRLRLVPHPDIEIVGEAEDGHSAAAEILRLRPDLVILDVQMPGMSGIDALDAVADTHVPIVLFITAFDEYALKAFDYFSLGYIVKPFDQAQFDAALLKVRMARSGLREAERLTGLLDQPATYLPQEAMPRLTRLTVASGNHYVIVKVTEIDWFQADANYVEAHTADRVFTLRDTMAELDAKLDPEMFARIHRSTIVNLDRIAKVYSDSHGDCTVVLKTGTRLRASRRWRNRLIP